MIVSKIMFVLLLAASGYLHPAPVVQRQHWETYTLTAYTCYDQACLTASGRRAGPGTVASTSLAMGTRVWIQKLGEFRVEDRGDLESKQLDVWMPSREEAIQFGVQERQVRVLR